MKITKQKLKKMVNEELQRINESISLSSIRNLDDNQLKDLFVKFHQLSQNQQVTGDNVISILNSIVLPPRAPIAVDPSKVAAVQRDTSGRPVPKDVSWSDTSNNNYQDAVNKAWAEVPDSGEKTANLRKK